MNTKWRKINSEERITGEEEEEKEEEEEEEEEQEEDKQVRKKRNNNSNLDNNIKNTARKEAVAMSFVNAFLAM